MKARLLVFLFSVVLVGLFSSGCTYRSANFQVVNVSGSDSCSATGECLLKFTVVDSKGKPLTGYSLTDAQWYKVSIDFGDGTQYKNYLDKCITSGYCQILPNNFMGFKHNYTKNGNFVVVLDIHDLYFKGVYDKLPIFININPCLNQDIACSKVNGTCIPEGTTDYRCMCKSGFINSYLDDHSCIVDPCMRADGSRYDCDGKGFCTVDEHNDPVCICRDGFRPSIIDYGLRSAERPDPTCEKESCYSESADEEGVELEGGYAKSVIRPFEINLKEEGDQIIVDFSPTEVTTGCVKEATVDQTTETLETTANVRNLIKRDAYLLASSNCNFPAKDTFTPLFDYYMGFKDSPIELLCHSDHTLLKERKKIITDYAVTGCDNYVRKKYYNWMMWQDIAAEAFSEPFKTVQFSATPIVSGMEPSFNTPKTEWLRAYGGRILFWGDKMMQGTQAIASLSLFRFSDINNIQPLNPFVVVKNKMLGRSKEDIREDYYYPETWISYMESYKTARAWIDTMRSNYPQWDVFFTEKGDDAAFDNYRLMREGLLDVLSTTVILRDFKNGLKETGSGKKPGYWLKAILAFRQRTGTWPKEIRQALSDPTQDIEAAMAQSQLHDDEDLQIDVNGSTCEVCSDLLVYETFDDNEVFMFRDNSGRLMRYFPDNVIVEMWDILSEKEQAAVIARINGGMENIINHTNEKPSEDYTGPYETTVDEREELEAKLFEKLSPTNLNELFIGKKLHNTLTSLLNDALAAADMAGCLLSKNEAAGNPMFQKQLEFCRWLPEVFVEKVRADLNGKQYNTLSQDCHKVFPEYNDMLYLNEEYQTCVENGKPYANKTIIEMMQYDFSRCNSNLPECGEGDTGCTPLDELEHFDEFKCYGDKPELYDLKYTCTFLQVKCEKEELNSNCNIDEDAALQSFYPLHSSDYSVDKEMFDVVFKNVAYYREGDFPDAKNEFYFGSFTGIESALEGFDFNEECFLSGDELKNALLGGKFNYPANDPVAQLKIFFATDRSPACYAERGLHQRAYYFFCDSPSESISTDSDNYFCEDRTQRKVNVTEVLESDTVNGLKGSCFKKNSSGTLVPAGIFETLDINNSYSAIDIMSPYEWNDNNIRTDVSKKLRIFKNTYDPDSQGRFHFTAKSICMDKNTGEWFANDTLSSGTPTPICERECIDVDIPYSRTITPAPDYANYFDETKGNLLNNPDFGQNGSGFYGKYTSDVLHFDQYLKRFEEYRKYRMSLLNMKLASSNMGGHAGFYSDEDSGKKGFNTYEYDVYKLGNDLFNVHMGYAYGYGIEGFEVIEDYIKQVQEEGKSWDVDTLVNLTRIVDGYDFVSGENKNIFSAVLTDICQKKYAELFNSEVSGSKEKCLGMLQYCEKDKTGLVNCHGMEGYDKIAYQYLEDGQTYYFDECVDNNTVGCYKERGLAFPCKEEDDIQSCFAKMGDFALTPYLYGYFGAGATIFGYPLSMNAVNNIEEDIKNAITDAIAQKLENIVDQAAKPIRKGVDAGCDKLIEEIKKFDVDSEIVVPEIAFAFDMSSDFLNSDIGTEANALKGKIQQFAEVIESTLGEIQNGSGSAVSFVDDVSAPAETAVTQTMMLTGGLLEKFVALVADELNQGDCSLTEVQIDELLAQITAAGNLEKKLVAVEHDFRLVTEKLDKDLASNADLKKRRLFEATQGALVNYIGVLRTVFKEQIDRISGSGGLISQIIRGQLGNILDNPGVFGDSSLMYAGGHPDEAFEIMAYLKLNSQGTIQAPSNSSGMEGIDDFHQELRETQRLYRMHIYRLGQYIYNSEDDSAEGKDNSAAKVLAQFDLQRIKDLTPAIDATYSGSCEGFDPDTDAYTICQVLAAKAFVSDVLNADQPENAVKDLLKKEGKQNFEILMTVFRGNELKAKAVVTDMIRELDRSKKEITAALKNFEKKIGEQYPNLNPNSVDWKAYTKQGEKELLKAKLIPLVTRQLLSVADGTQEFNTESSGDFARYDWSFKTVLGEYDFGIVQVKLTAGVFLNYSAKYSVSMGVIENNALAELAIRPDTNEIVATSVPFGLAAGFNARIDNPLKIWANAEGTASISAWGIVNAHGTLGVDIDVLYINVPFSAGAKLSFDTAKMVPYIDFDAYLGAQLDILPHSEVYFKASVDIVGIKIIDTGRMTLFEDFLPSYSYTYTIFEMPEDYQRVYLDDIIHLF